MLCRGRSIASRAAGGCQAGPGVLPKLGGAVVEFDQLARQITSNRIFALAGRLSGGARTGRVGYNANRRELRVSWRWINAYYWFVEVASLFLSGIIIFHCLHRLVDSA